MAPLRGLRDPKGGVANINGQMHYLWRPGDHDGKVLESFASKTRYKPAALKFMKKLKKRHRPAKVVTTDGLGGHEGTWQRQEAGDWPLGQQPM